MKTIIVLMLITPLLCFSSSIENDVHFSNFLAKARALDLPTYNIEKLKNMVTIKEDKQKLKKYSAVALFQGSSIYVQSEKTSMVLLYLSLQMIKN
ncbi:MAG: hypothetical protein HOK38_00270 [Flavobacteriaceae bacterium]|nr:hypothetical protein [Flavobacteriaceae bacterium]